MKFEGPITKVNDKQIKTETFYCEVTPKDTFQIVRISRQDLISIQSGRVNFIGYEKPKQGTVEELEDVFLLSWVYLDAHGNPRIRPIVGNHFGGSQTFADAAALAGDVWRNSARYRTSLIRG